MQSTLRCIFRNNNAHSEKKYDCAKFRTFCSFVWNVLDCLLMKKSETCIHFFTPHHRCEVILHTDIISHCLGMSYYVNFLEGLDSNEFHIKWRFGTILKKWKSWGPFRSYQLNSTANSAHFAWFLGKWAKLAVVFCW